MGDKELNGAYYGPNIPPPAKTYQAHGRGGAGCGCGIGSCLLKVLATLIIVIALAAFIFWLVVRPQEPKFRVTNASLTRFDHFNSTLRYSLALNVSVRNPNRKLGIYYDLIEARAKYEGERFGLVDMTPFYQGTKNTTVISPVFDSQRVVVLDRGQLQDFNDDRIAGVYSIEVVFRLRVRFKLGSAKTRKLKPDVKCKLKVPFTPINGTRVSSEVFQPKKCDFDF